MNNIENSVSNNLSFENITSVEKLYNAMQAENSLNEEAILIINLLSWINSVIQYDPFSDKPIYSDIDNFLLRVVDYCNVKDRVIKDHIYHLIEFTGKELDYILKNLREKIIRNHENMPLYSVRETDSKCLQILARKPGKTVKEKLSNQPYMTAVKRHFSTDTLENQLLKLYVTKLQELLFLRKEALDNSKMLSNDEASDFISKINYWKHSEGAQNIGQWKNNPPNNVLLQDRRYRKVWLGWSMLRNSDNLLSKFTTNITLHLTNFLFWNLATEFSKYSCVRIFQKPLIFSISENRRFTSKEDFVGIIHSKENTFISIHCKKDKNKIVLDLDGSEYSIHITNKSICIINFSGKESFEDISLNNLTDIPSKLINFVVSSLASTELDKKKDESIVIGRKASIDLSYSYPMYYDGDIISQLQNRLMIQNWNSIQHKEHIYKIETKNSKAISFKDQLYTIESYTLKSLISVNEHNDQSSKLKVIDAAIQLFNSLRKKFNVDRILYAIPDILDDFDAEPIRIGINSSFNSSYPVPISIAICEDALQNGKLNNLKNGDLVIVVDSYMKGVSLTPIIVEYDENLKKESPETRGFQLVRYPSLFKDEDKFYDDLKFSSCSDNLKEYLLTLFGIDGIDKNLSCVSYILDNFEHPQLDLNGFNEQISIDNKHITKVTKNIGHSLINNQIHVLANKSFISLESLNNLPEISSKYVSSSTSKGVYLVEEIENKLKESTLWLDFLPELKMEASVNGKKELLSLVKNKKIKPILNVSVPINISWNFTLPAKKKFYHFPLVKGNGSKSSNYEAFIESDVFPLEENLDCSLELTYTYGAENAYKLAFIPKRKVGESKFNVQWKFKSDIPIDYDSLPIPPYPQKKTEEFYRKYPSKDPKDKRTTDLIDRFIENLDFMKQLSFVNDCSVEEQKEKVIHKYDREELYIEFIFKTKFNERYSYLLPKKQSQNEEILNSIKKAKILYKETKTSKKGYKIYTIKDIRRKIRFPMIVLFNDGMKITEFNSSFCNHCLDFIQFVSSIILDNNYPKEFLYECLYLVCSMTDELPSNIVDFILQKEFYKDCYFSDRILGKSLHDCKKNWQKEYLKNLLNSINEAENKNNKTNNYKKVNNNAFKIISKSIWKNSNFALTLSLGDIIVISKYTVSVLKNEISEISKKNNNDVESHLNSIVSCLELLLGLLRTRNIEDLEIKKFFAPNSNLNNEFLINLNTLEKLCLENNYQLKSFVKIEIDKKLNTENIPVLLDACKIFLLCEDESDSIRITGLELDNE